MIYFDFCKIVCKDSRDIMQVQNCFSTTQLTYGYQVHTDGLAILQLTERERKREKKKNHHKENLKSSHLMCVFKYTKTLKKKMPENRFCHTRFKGVVRFKINFIVSLRIYFSVLVSALLFFCISYNSVTINAIH